MLIKYTSHFVCEVPSTTLTTFDSELFLTQNRCVKNCYVLIQQTSTAAHPIMHLQHTN
uniref:Uncharacterized protein n=1 Tax=Arion vulgaris TaxID=1028688 RepID=A0A0B7BSV6_9EUPU